MQSNNARLLAIVAGTLLLLVVFVSFRAQTFHYCVDESVQSFRLSDSSEPCRADERPMEWRGLWREEGLRSKFRMLRTTVAEAFGLK
jgi:hypothetical protein